MADISEIDSANAARSAPITGPARPAASNRPAGGERGENPLRTRPADSINLSDEARLAARGADKNGTTPPSSQIEGKPALKLEGSYSERTQADESTRPGRVRAALDEGGYVTGEKLDIAVSRLIDDVLGS